jgi:nitroreductase
MRSVRACVAPAVKRVFFVSLTAATVAVSAPGPGRAEELPAIQLNAPDLKRGLPFMEALSVKASAREWSDVELSLQDLSDLLWAANGINRPDEKKYTASSAMNAHDVDLYVFMKDGVYVYDADGHALNPVLAGDFRSQIMRTPPPRTTDASSPSPPPEPTPSEPPIQIILISDSTRFRAGTPELKYEWGAIDTGIVSQNISLFCAATGLKTRPRASMDREKIRTLLSLKEGQNVFLNHPVGYAAE